MQFVHAAEGKHRLEVKVPEPVNKRRPWGRHCCGYAVSLDTFQCLQNWVPLNEVVASKERRLRPTTDYVAAEGR